MRTLVLVVVTACWTGSSGKAVAPEPQLAPEPAAPSSAFRVRRAGNACDHTIAEMADKVRAELTSTGLSEATIDDLIEAARQSCRETAWSSELLDCYDRAADATELNKCQSLMTAEQSEDVSRRMMEVISRSNSFAPPPPPPPPPPSP